MTLIGREVARSPPRGIATTAALGSGAAASAVAGVPGNDGVDGIVLVDGSGDDEDSLVDIALDACETVVNTAACTDRQIAVMPLEDEDMLLLMRWLICAMVFGWVTLLPILLIEPHENRPRQKYSQFVTITKT